MSQTVLSDLAGEAAPAPATDTVLEIEDLQTQFRTPAGIIRAVDGVSYTLRRGETLCVVGESGCGKSVTALSILRLIASPPGRIAGGRILFEGRNLLDLSDTAMERIRGNEISMIFQEPMTSLNPLYTVGRHVIVHSSAIAASGATPWPRRSRCCTAFPSPIRSNAPAPTRTSCPAACANG